MKDDFFGKPRKWTLAEGVEKLFPERGKPEISDVYVDVAPVIAGISFAPDQEHGQDGVSVILTVNDEALNPNENGYIELSGFMVPAAGETRGHLAMRLSQAMGIHPELPFWEVESESTP